jgi:hypothetical protein
LELTAQTESSKSLCLTKHRPSSLVLMETVKARLHSGVRVVMDAARGKGF